MKVIFIQVGKTTDKRIAELCADYEKRIGHYLPFSVVTVADLKNAKTLTQAQQMQKEAEGILRLLADGDYLVQLDEHGKEFRSIEWANSLQSKMQSSCKRLVFVIGGPYGFADEVKARANEKISLSKMTFSHQMVRLFFLEQLYRAMTILKGEPYHHE